MSLEQTVAPGIGGLPRLVLDAAGGAHSEIYLHGAHVTSWTPAGGEERLYVSELAEFREDAAIRGGIPVIFPQFSGLGRLPKHGFARVTTWNLDKVAERADGGACATFTLRDSPATRELWAGRFEAQLQVALSGRRVEVTLSVRNTGSEPFSFTAALHTYLHVKDVAQAGIAGLGGRTYIDQAAGGAEAVQHEEPLSIRGEIDRIYPDAPPTVVVREPGRETEVSAYGFSDLVVWNPGPERAAGLKDLEPDGYRHMLCVEAAVIDPPVTLAPDQTWFGLQALVARS